MYLLKYLLIPYVLFFFYFFNTRLIIIWHLCLPSIVSEHQFHHKSTFYNNFDCVFLWILNKCKPHKLLLSRLFFTGSPLLFVLWERLSLTKSNTKIKRIPYLSLLTVFTPTFVGIVRFLSPVSIRLNTYDISLVTLCYSVKIQLLVILDFKIFTRDNRYTS